MKDLNISSIPLQELILEACQNFNIELYIKLPMANDILHRNVMKSKIIELELLIPILSEIIKNNTDA
jgi:phosphosulfolactate synthase (CoM biosynthesis protein A)